MGQTSKIGYSGVQRLWQGIAAVVAAGLLVLGPMPGQAANLADAFNRIDQIIEDDDLQRHLPDLPQQAEEQPDDSIEQPAPSQPVRPPEITSPDAEVKGSADVMAAFLWLLAAVAICVILFRVAGALQHLRSGKAAKRKLPAAAGTDLPAATAPPPKDEADRLADEGDFDQAIRVLFLRCMDAIRKLHGARIRSTTAREVLALFTATASAHEVLKVIVAAEEFTHFGGRNANRQLYDKCRESHDHFLDLLKTSRIGREMQQ